MAAGAGLVWNRAVSRAASSRSTVKPFHLLGSALLLSENQPETQTEPDCVQQDGFELNSSGIAVSEKYVCSYEAKPWGKGG